jgi:hypothetical protein
MGDLSKDAYDKMFKGTPMEGQYDTVVAEAKKNNVSPALVAGVIAHESGKGTSRFIREMNNPAGLMDPKTGMAKGQSFGSIQEGIAASARTIGKNFERGGGSIAGMAKSYAPVGAANDPRGLNSGWTSGVTGYTSRLSTGGAAAAASGASAPPGDVIKEAEKVAHLGPAAVSQYMANAGYPKSGAWCGEFAASVIKQAGGTPPANPQVASNWRNYGHQVDVPQPGDIAVRKPEYHGRLGTGRTGDTGSHVTIYQGPGEGKGTFTGEGGNQGAMINPRMSLRQYDFFRGDALDKSSDVTVTGKGELNVNVNAPPGTRTSASGEGLLKDTRVQQETQMTPASKQGATSAIEAD